MSVTINPSGKAQLEAELLKYGQRIGAQIERRAKRLAPVDTGRLRASITNTVEQDGDGVLVTVYSDVEYAPYLETGTRRQQAQPYLRPALAQVMGEQS